MRRRVGRRRSVAHDVATGRVWDVVWNGLVSLDWGLVSCCVGSCLRLFCLILLWGTGKRVFERRGGTWSLVRLRYFWAFVGGCRCSRVNASQRKGRGALGLRFLIFKRRLSGPGVLRPPFRVNSRL